MIEGQKETMEINQITVLKDLVLIYGSLNTKIHRISRLKKVDESRVSSSIENLKSKLKNVFSEVTKNKVKDEISNEPETFARWTEFVKFGMLNIIQEIMKNSEIPIHDPVVKLPTVGLEEI